MKKVIFIVFHIVSLFSFAQDDSDVYNKAINFVITDVSTKLPKKSKIYFSKNVLALTKSSYVPLYIMNHEFSVDTNGFDNKYEGIMDTVIDIIKVIPFENNKLKKKKRSGTYEILLYSQLEYNTHSFYTEIVVTNGVRGYIYLLFIKDDTIDSIVNAFIL